MKFFFTIGRNAKYYNNYGHNRNQNNRIFIETHRKMASITFAAFFCSKIFLKQIFIKQTDIFVSTYIFVADTDSGVRTVVCRLNIFLYIWYFVSDSIWASRNLFFLYVFIFMQWIFPSTFFIQLVEAEKSHFIRQNKLYASIKTMDKIKFGQCTHIFCRKKAFYKWLSANNKNAPFLSAFWCWAFYFFSLSLFPYFILLFSKLKFS